MPSLSLSPWWPGKILCTSSLTAGVIFAGDVLRGRWCGMSVQSLAVGLARNAVVKAKRAGCIQRVKWQSGK